MAKVSLGISIACMLTIESKNTCPHLFHNATNKFLNANHLILCFQASKTGNPPGSHLDKFKTIINYFFQISTLTSSFSAISLMVILQLSLIFWPMIMLFCTLWTERETLISKLVLKFWINLKLNDTFHCKKLDDNSLCNTWWGFSPKQQGKKLPSTFCSDMLISIDRNDGKNNYHN